MISRESMRSVPVVPDPRAEVAVATAQRILVSDYSMSG
jgi:hypothetical protein